MIELLLLSMKLVAAVPVSAPPTRKKTSSTVTGSLAWLTAEPWVPTCSNAGELVGPASKIRPETFTPLTSATFIVTLPLPGIRVGKPRPMIFVSAFVTLIVEP